MAKSIATRRFWLSVDRYRLRVISRVLVEPACNAVPEKLNYLPQTIFDSTYVLVVVYSAIVTVVLFLNFFLGSSLVIARLEYL